MAIDVQRLTEYPDLLTAVQPRPIRREEEAQSYLEIIDALTDLREMSEGQRDLLGLLGQLVYDWETEHEAQVTASPEEVVAFLLESNGLRQVDLVGSVFPTRSGVSDFLAGRRPLSYERVEKLAAFFHVSPSLFYAPPHAVVPSGGASGRAKDR